MTNIIDNKIMAGIITYIVFILSATIHEYSHGKSAFALGDYTAASMGRLTLNPLAHIDILGTVILPLIAIFTNIPVIGFMKPVPINPYNFKKMERGQAIVSFAGPFSNFTLSLIAFILIKIITFPMAAGINMKMPLMHYLITLTANDTVITIFTPLASIVATFLFYFYFINITLMCFNLLPFPPLDGGWILRYFLPYKGKQFYDKIYPYGFVILYAMLFFGVFRLVLLPIQSFTTMILGNSLFMLFTM